MNNKNVRVKGLVELQDIFPTLSELAGLPAPKKIHGVSAVKLMENPDGQGKRAVFAQGILHEGSGMVVTTENGTYMEWDKGKYREYYDISKDPDAWFNLVGNPEYRKAVKQHKRLLYKYFNKSVDRYHYFEGI
jgi:arylsulfatase A-like enzyme